MCDVPSVYTRQRQEHQKGQIDYRLIIKFCSLAAHFLETGCCFSFKGMLESWPSLESSGLSRPVEAFEMEVHPG